jgi:hypothetical protein
MRVGEPGANDAIGHAATPTGWQRPATPPQAPAAEPAKRRNDGGWVSLDPNRR